MVKKNFEITKGCDQLREICSNIPPLRNGRYELLIKEIRGGKSGSQRNYLWGVVYKFIADEVGMQLDDVHDWMRDKFLRLTDEEIINKIPTLASIKDLPTIVRSTESLSKEEYAFYTDSICKWAYDFLNCLIPEAK